MLKTYLSPYITAEFDGDCIMVKSVAGNEPQGAVVLEFEEIEELARFASEVLDNFFYEEEMLN